MSNIKDLFEKNNIKVLPGKSLGNLVTGSGVESAGYIKSTDEEKLRFEPYVDYSIPKSFARYGSAEKYYTDTIDYIINRYPYDGSGKEKANWYLSSSYFDNYLFENEYPRTTGYISLGRNYDFSLQQDGGYDVSTRSEWISFLGGPHTASSGMIGKPLALTFTDSNYYNDTTRQSNLELDGENGITLEFWINKESYNDATESRRQVIFDAWNNVSTGGGSPVPSNYGRFRVEISGSGTTLPPIFHVELLSGSDGFCADTFPPGPHTVPMIELTGSSLTGSWNHFALSFINTNTQMKGNLYQNGEQVYTVSAGTPMGKVTGSMFGRIGALETGVMDFAGLDFGAAGDAKLSASLDEVRFWKTQRNDTQVGRYWFSQVNAGTNTDDSNVDLGVYYKFNEGIVNTATVAALDASVLDYSGRVTNGTWTGYQVGSRFTGSAMIISKAALSEFKDPIIYPSNPLVSVFRTTKKNIGYDYDVRNNSGIYTSIPEYITDNPQEIRGQTLKNLTQIIGSYFDDVQLQIESLPKVKNVQYTTGSQKIAPFINRFLSGVGLYTPEIFADASALEYYASRDDFLDFSKKLNDTKNRIYENIYNNLVHVFKTKGTENSFRNLMRCYGVDEPLMKISLYGDETTQELRTNSRNTTAQKSFVDFNNVDRFDSTVYQQTSSTDTNTRNFITASSDMQFIPKTMQAEAIFPKKFKQDSELYFRTPFISCSLFGAHTPTSADQTDLTWATNDWSNFQVYAVRTELESDDVYFKLTSSTGGVIPLITSSVYTDVYANTKWNLAVRIKPDNHYIPGLSGSEAGNASVEFVGYNSLGDNVENNFYLTASISLASASAFLSSSTRVYAGSHRTNFTGSAIDLSDAKISSVRYWIDDLPNEAIEAHSKDASAFGPLEPHKSAYLVKNTADFFQQIEVPQAKTLSLSWTFDTVTGSSDSSTGSPTLSDANFFVPDLSSGSTATTSEYGWLGPVVNFLHSGKGDFFLPFDTNAVNREYVYSAKQLAPEILNSSNMVEVRTQDDELFTRETRPQNYFYAIEKSQSAIISEEMMKWFATIKDFNFLIGDPVNRYRQEYKPLAKLREVYFRSVGNTIDFERFVDFFKWVDDSLSQMLMQLVPASANFAEKVRTMIESHVLERNKYWSKFPTLEMKLNDPEAGARGIVEGTYPWKRGHAPIPLAQDDNCYWANNRASASVFPSGDTEVDAGRNIYRLADDFRNGSPPTLTDISSGTPTQYQGSAYAIRNFTKTYLLKTKEMPELKGGTNVARIKNLQYAHTELPFGASTKLTISSSQVEGNIDCNDVVDPNDKVKLRYKLTNNPIGYKSGNGNIFAPFDLMSSSVSSGYASQLPRMGPDAVVLDLVNYHNDTYGSDKEVPMQGPFTEKYVGGREYRHVPFWLTGSQSRPEAWNLDFEGSDFTNTKSFCFDGPGPFAAGEPAVELSWPGDCPSSAVWGVSLWFKSGVSATDQTLICQQWDGDPFGSYDMKDWNINLRNSGDVEFEIWTEPLGLTSTVIVPYGGEQFDDNQWHLLCASFNPGDGAFGAIKISIDGRTPLVVTTAAFPYIASGHGGVAILSLGSQYAGEDPSPEYRWMPMIGCIDEVGIWSEDILADYPLVADKIWNDGCPADLTASGGPTDEVVLSRWYRMGDAPTDSAVPGMTIEDVIPPHMNATVWNTKGDEIKLDTACPGSSVGSGNNLVLTARTANQARSTILREPLAKRPVNIRNIKQTTGSTIIGNYSHEYEVLQTSGRKINNRFFVKNDGFVPEYVASPWVAGLIDYKLPDFSKYGATKNIFVERFNAPGGPDVSSRGVLDLYAEEYAVRNDLNQRNMVVRGPLNEWSTEHCGQFGIKSVSGAIEGYRQPMTSSYNTLANYHKVNKNAGQPYGWIKDFSREVEWTQFQSKYEDPFGNPGPGPYLTNYDQTLVSYNSQPGGTGGEPDQAMSHQKISRMGYLEFEVSSIGSNEKWAVGLDSDFVRFLYNTTGGEWDYSFFCDNNTVSPLEDGVAASTSWVVSIGDKLRIVIDKSKVYYQYLPVSTVNWITKHTAINPPSGDYYPLASFHHYSPSRTISITNAHISNPQYDNWFVQHTIPRSDLQYAWINDSYNNKVDQPWGHAGSPDCGRNNFSVPSGSSESMAAPAIQFVSASNWDFTGITDGSDYAVNFVNMLPMLPTSELLPESYKYQLGEFGVDWYSPVNVTFYNNGSTIKKTGGAVADWDAGAAAHTQIIDNGYVEFEVNQVDANIGMGFNNDPPVAVTFTDMEYMLLCGSDGHFFVEEDGVFYVDLGTYKIGDKFRLVRKDNKVLYQHSSNGGRTFITKYTSTKLIREQGKLLFIDTAIFNLGASMSNIKVSIAQNTLWPGYGYVSGSTNQPSYINSYFNNLNGPYGYPSWKQIRTGEHPVARYQKNNNIISFKKEEDIYGSNEVTPANAGLTRDTLIHFTEPPVTFRYKPVGTTLILSGSPDPLTLDSVYGNNMGGFPNPDINNFLGTSIKCEEQMFDRIKGMYHNAPSDSPVERMVSVDYNEIVYPREIHAGLKEYRQRTEYAEVANGTDIYSGGKIIFVSASLSNGSNGIDRGPLYRRTFWRTDPVFRDRREAATMIIGQDRSGGSTANTTPAITGTLPNSQAIYDGLGTSLNGFGSTPIVFAENTTESGLTNMLSGSDTLGLTYLDYPDAGELNSNNYQRMSSYFGTTFNSSLISSPNSFSANCAIYPTASCYYYHQQMWNAPQWFGTSSLGMKWRVAELSGKNPWFDTYEDYVQDIRGTGKSFTIIPEFRISQHMDYYADGLFRKQNDQFLTLDGATITSSAVAPTSSNLSRGFDKQFFSEYSNTDFQKYFGKFDADNQVSEITLKCNGIKKLLPYHGFYPSHRTLQVASLFSQSIAPYIGGIAWDSGTTTDAASPPSGALAVQSLLQPYYAPGIIYNTIKAGIACDWAAYTGSAVTVEEQPGGYRNSYIPSASNYRIPFESILNPLVEIGIPASSSNGEGTLQLLGPTYQSFPAPFDTTWAGDHGAIRTPYIELDNNQRSRALGSPKYNQYRMAISNFLAEIPSFFLKDEQLKAIVSKPAGEVSLTSGSTYYMNVYLEKDPNIVMIQDYWNGLRGGTDNFYYPPDDPLTSDTEFRSFNGRYFGPPVKAGSSSAIPTTNDGWGASATKMGDPAYAPYTPPYFYGKSVATIAYTADAGDVTEFNYKKIFDNGIIVQTNPTMDGMFETLQSDVSQAPALSGAMGLASSLDLFGLFSEKEATQDGETGNLTAVTNKPDYKRNSWVISPKMETPVLDFSTQPEQKGWGRGMWSGYGNVLTSSTGITFGIEETFKGPIIEYCDNNIDGNKIGWYGDVDVSVVYAGDESTVTKTGGGSGWNAGAAGARPVITNGFWQFNIDNISDGVIAGLNTDPSSFTTYTDMEYAIQTRDTSSFNAGNPWMSNNIVVVDVGIISTLTKFGGADAYDAKAEGGDPVESGGWWEFEVANTEKMQCGLINPPSTIGEYYLEFDTGNVTLYESDGTTPTLVPGTTTFIPGDKFRIYPDRDGKVKYQKLIVGVWTEFAESPTTVSTLLWVYINLYQTTGPTVSEVTGVYQTSRPALAIYESGNQIGSTLGNYKSGDKLRLFRSNDDTIQYQHSSGSLNTFSTLYTSTSSSAGSILYPDLSLHSDTLPDSISLASQHPSDALFCYQTGSLLQKCFTSPEEKQVGEIASQKEISEAIVAIPFSVRGFSKESRHPETTVVMDKNFFRIDQDVFDANRQHYLRSKNKIFSADPLLGQSVTKMLKMMDKYIIPPELDSLNFPEGNLKVDPFVMYMFEFNHSLSQQDLADIWQGVMPDISRIAQLSDTTVDDNVFSHPTGPNEFFGGKMIPEDIRWMVFKVKKRGNFNYYKMTADTTDDDKFNFDFNVGGKDLPYSYNWPYDFCSLVELAEIEVKDQFITSKPVIEIPGTENLGVTRILDHIKNVSSGEEEE